MTDRLDRIERLLETIAVSQQATQTNIDGVTDRLNQITDRMDATSATIAQLATQQITTQNQIDSLTALVLDNRQSIAVLGYRSVQHEGRLDNLEGQGEVE